MTNVNLHSHLLVSTYVVCERTICDTWACWSGWNFGPNSSEYPYSVVQNTPPMKIVRDSKSESFRIPPNENCQRFQIQQFQNTPHPKMKIVRVQIQEFQNTTPPPPPPPPQIGKTSDFKTSEYSCNPGDRMWRLICNPRGYHSFPLVTTFQFILVRSCTEMPTSPTLCITGKTRLCHFFCPDMVCISVSSGVTCWGIKGEIIPALWGGGGRRRSYLVAAKRFWQLDPLIFGPVPPFLIHATCRSSLGRKKVSGAKQSNFKIPSLWMGNVVHILFLETPLLISAKTPINSMVVISKNYRINRVIYS